LLIIFADGRIYIFLKGKVVLVLSEFKHYAMKAYGGVDVQIHISFTSALVGV
jgi:hypothetical protein